MEIQSFPYLEDAGTDWETEEELSVIVVPRSYASGYYFLVNAHRHDAMRFEVDAEEIDAYVEMFQWMRDYAFAHPIDKQEQSMPVPRPESEPAEGEDG